MRQSRLPAETARCRWSRARDTAPSSNASNPLSRNRRASLDAGGAAESRIASAPDLSPSRRRTRAADTMASASPGLARAAASVAASLRRPRAAFVSAGEGCFSLGAGFSGIFRAEVCRPCPGRFKEATPEHPAKTTATTRQPAASRIPLLPPPSQPKPIAPSPTPPSTGPHRTTSVPGALGDSRRHKTLLGKSVPSIPRPRANGQTQGIGCRASVSSLLKD
jgi:hypothetical protein